MLILNFSHPFTLNQQQQLAQLLATEFTVQNVPVQIDRSVSLAEIATQLVDGLVFTPEQFSTLPLLLNPPGLAPLALALQAELHGRCGYFLPMINICPVAGSIPMQFMVVEIVNLQHIREQARERRF